MVIIINPHTRERQKEYLSGPISKEVILMEIDRKLNPEKYQLKTKYKKGELSIEKALDIFQSGNFKSISVVKKIKTKKPKSKPIVTTQENSIVIITEIKKRKKSPKVKLRKKYKNLVWELTNNQDLSSIKNIEKRKFKEFDLDHKISIFYGFHNNIPAHIIAHPSNLRIIPHKENAFKGTKIHIDKHNKWILETLHL